MMGESTVLGRGDESYGTDRTYAASRGFLATMILLLVAGGGFCVQPSGDGPLPEATVLSGIDGKLLRADANDAWWFELTADVQSDSRRVLAERRFKLLPCAILERLIADVNDRYTPQYRLWARITQYEGTNYLLPMYFLPLSKFKSDDGTEDAGGQTQDRGPRAEAGLQPSDPELAIPPEIIERLKNRRPLREPLRNPHKPAQETRPGTPAHVDRMLVNKVGLIEAADVRALERTSVAALPDARIYASTLPRFYFIPYALGWNVSSVRYELLPCSVLERVRQLQGSEIETIRFNVAGLVTEFQGRQYLLLQRAAPVYNYGNFSR